MASDEARSEEASEQILHSRSDSSFGHRLRRIFSFPGRASDPENLRSELTSLSDRLDLLRTEAEERNIDGIRQYLDQAASELERANKALSRKDIVSFWRYFAEAKKWELVGIERLYHQSTDDSDFGLNLLDLRAQDAQLQASDVLDTSRRQKVEQGLSQTSSQERYYRNIVSAIHMIHQQRINDYLETVRGRFLHNQLTFFVSVIIICLYTTFGIWWWKFDGVPIGRVPPPLFTLEFITSMVLFGAIGAAVSSLLSLSKVLQKQNVPEQVGSLRLAFARVVLGAASALIIYIFVLAEIVNLFAISASALLAVAFVSGFSERQLVKTVKTFTGERDTGANDQFLPSDWSKEEETKTTENSDRK